MQSYATHISTTSMLFVGLDVHKDSIAARIVDAATGEIIRETEFSNDLARMRTFIRRFRSRHGEPRCCYEASSCGFVLYRFLTGLGVHCAVIAPSSIPQRAGDRINTDRRDALKLATLYAADLPTAVSVTRRIGRGRGHRMEGSAQTTQGLLDPDPQEILSCGQLGRGARAGGLSLEGHADTDANPLGAGRLAGTTTIKNY